MDAGNVEKEISRLDHFVGIFDIKTLPEIKLVSYPCSLIVLTNEHWISIFMNQNVIEIMDSMGYLATKTFSKYLRIFLSAHLVGKRLITTPQIQSDDSNLCALYSICFLYFRTFKCGNLCDFCQLFTTDLNKNCVIISKLYKNVKRINKSF